MNVSNISSSQQVATATSSTGGREEVGQETFLQLLLAQLEHQDPLSPMENTEFTTQLAQFNTLEQMETINQTLQALLSEQETANTVQAANLIGKEVKAQGNTLYLQPDQSIPLSYRLLADSAKVTISIFNDAGNLVHTITQENQRAGDQVVEWDGRDGQGVPLPEGAYIFLVSAEDAQGTSVPVETFIEGRVEEVHYEGDRPYLLIGKNRVDVSALVSVKESE